MRPRGGDGSLQYTEASMSPLTALIPQKKQISGQNVTVMI